MRHEHEQKTPMSQAQYRAQGGNCCPVCEDDSLDYDSVTVDNGLVTQSCVCLTCDATWSDVYRLAGYLREGKEGEDDWETFLDTTILELPRP